MERVRLKENTENLGLALSDSIKSEHLEELGTDILELITDSFTDSNVIADIPIVGMFYKAGKSLISIRDKLFLKKILVFLQEHQDIPLEKRVLFLSQFETEKDKKEFGEAVLMLLYNLNNIKKAEIVGKLSRAHILGHINEEEFSILIDCTDRMFIADFNSLITKDISTVVSNSSNYPLAQRLQNAGLMSIESTLLDGLIKLKINQYGQLLQKLINKY